MKNSQKSRALRYMVGKEFDQLAKIYSQDPVVKASSKNIRL